MDPITAQRIPEQVLQDIQTSRDKTQTPTNTAQECKAIKGRRRKTPEERLQALQARAEMLEARLKAKRRKADTREKIVIGGWIKALCRNDADKTRIMDYLGRYAASRRVDVPKLLRPEVETAIKKRQPPRQEKPQQRGSSNEQRGSSNK